MSARPSLIDRLRGGRWEVVVAYAAGGFALLEAVDLFTERFGLPAWLFTAAVLLLLLGLPLGLLLSHWITRARAPAGADDHSSDESRPEAGNRPATSSVPRRHRLTWRGASAAFVGVLALWGVVAAGWIAATSDERRALELQATALAELPRLAEKGEFERAHTLARQVEAVLPEDSIITALRPRFSATVEIESEPAGAVVYRRPYDGGDWERLGSTPLAIWLPRVTSRLRYEKDGYRPAEIAHFGPVPLGVPYVELEPLDSDVPDDMVRIPGGEISVGSPGLEALPAVQVGDYYLDRHEVTNREYAAFVEAGGYEDPVYWEHRFREDGRTLSFAEATARFTDRTGRPGPATWEGGSYPPGSADHPVGGLSWYEAAAYARFVGESLPTVYHWYHAASTWLSPYIIASSNYGGEGPAPVGEYDGLARFGAYDMAGNVREWVWNEAANGRHLLGGGWNDEPYTFIDAISQPAFDRSSTNGIRLARFTEDTGLEAARSPIPFPYRDYGAEKAVDDATFALYRRMYDYDRRPLDLGPVR